MEGRKAMSNIKNGQFWLGDCLELMKNIPDGSVDMILCDLPYGTTACSWDTIIPFAPLWEQYNRIAKPKAAIVLTASQPFTSKLVVSNIKQYAHCWIWNKVTARGHLTAKKRPMVQHEDILVFSHDGTHPFYNPQMIDRPLNKIEKRKKTEYGRTLIMGGNTQNAPTDKIYDKWFPKTILEFSNASSSVKSFHPTQKPVELFEYLIKTYTNEGETILDNCAGSGTTAIAAENTGRKWICIEQDPVYYYQAVGRVWNHAIPQT